MSGTAVMNETNLGAFADVRPMVPQAALPWLRELKATALEAFLDRGFPTPVEEQWRYTNVAPIARTAFVAAAGEAGARELLSQVTLGDSVHEVVFVNGRIAPSLSTLPPHGSCEVTSLTERASRDDSLRPQLASCAPPAEHPFVALNTALFEDGLFVRVPAGMSVEKPLHVVFITAGDGEEAVMTQPRVLVVAENNSSVTIVETYAGSRPRFFTNAVTEIIAGDGANVDHYRLEREGFDAFHVGSVWIRQRRDSSCISHVLTFGGALVRNEVFVALDGEGSSVVLDGLYLVDGKRHVDNQTKVDHLKPNATSIEFYKGVLDDGARGVFDGRIVVHKDAQKTSSRQTNNNLLLSRDAVVDTKPQLEIHADDVKCNHGSTVGQIDETALFYLRSRGIGEEQARRILTWAFASEIVERCRVAAVRDSLRRELLSRLPGRDRDGGEDVIPS